MKYILYYSNFCNHSKQLLMTLSKSKIKDQMHFISIDKRIKGQNNQTMIIMPNGKPIALPANITEVPSLLMLNHGNNVLTGPESILKFLEPQNKELLTKATNNNLEPLAFSVTEMNGMSDNYSYLDMSSDELAAKGNGGMRILHSFTSLDAVDKIETPPDDYEPNKVNSSDMEKIQAMRNNEVPQQIHRT